MALGGVQNPHLTECDLRFESVTTMGLLISSPSDMWSGIKQRPRKWLLSLLHPETPSQAFPLLPLSFELWRSEFTREECSHQGTTVLRQKLKQSGHLATKPVGKEFTVLAGPGEQRGVCAVPTPEVMENDIWDFPKGIL